MWSEIGNDLAARHKLITDVFEAMRFHNGGHYLAVDGKWHIDMIAFDERGPVLVAERVSQLQAGAHRDLRREMCQAIQMDDHDFAKAYPYRDASGLARFPDQYVSVAHDRPTI